MERLNLFEGIGVLCKNRSVLLLVIAFSSFIGLFFTLGNVLSSMFNPYALGPPQLAIIGITMLCSGFIGSALTGIILDKTGAYKSMI